MHRVIEQEINWNWKSGSTPEQTAIVSLQFHEYTHTTEI